MAGSDRFVSRAIKRFVASARRSWHSSDSTRRARFQSSWTLTRLAPPLAGALLAGPILAGLAGTVLPAFGYLPVLGGNALSLAPINTLLAEAGLVRGALIALVAGLVTPLVSLGVVFLFVAGWSGTRIFGRARSLASPLLAVPHAAAAFGLAFLIAPSGMIARLLSPELTGWLRPPDLLIVNDPHGLAMMAGLIVKEIPFLLLIALAALPQVDLPRSEALAAALGYGKVAGFLFGVWPRLYRQIRLAVFAVIAFSSSVVDVALILGPTAPPPLAVQLARMMQDPELAMRFVASAGALLQLLVTATALLIWLAAERLAATLRDRLAWQGLRWRADGALRAAGLGLLLLSVLFAFAGLGVLALWSVAGLWPFPDALPGAFNLASWQVSGGRLGGLIGTTFVLGLLSTLLAMIISVLCLAREDEVGIARGRRAQGLLYLPLIVPQTAFLFGLQLLFLRAGVEASLLALVLVHLVFVMPYVFLSLADPWRAFDRRYEQMAAGLGKRRAAILVRVRLPLLSRALLTAAALGFAVSVGLYLPTVLIGAGRLDTITTEAVALAAGGNRRVIGVYGFLQMILPAAGFLVASLAPALIFRQGRAGGGGRIVGI